MVQYIGPIILQIVLIALNAIFASAEIAVVTMGETKIEKLAEEGNKKAKKLTVIIATAANFTVNHKAFKKLVSSVKALI